MRYTLADSVRVLPGVGPKAVEELSRMGITSLADLFHWYPRRYIDAANPVTIARSPLGETVALSVEVISVEEGRTRGRNLKVLKVRCGDSSGEIQATWFNQPYLKQKLVPGSHWILIGTVTWFGGKRTLANPLLETKARVLPVYRQTKRISSRFLHQLIAQALPEAEIPEGIPENILQEHKISGIADVLRGLHLPGSMADVTEARRGMTFREVWEFFTGLEKVQEERGTEQGIRIPIEIELLQKLVAGLPFRLTPGQKRVSWDMVQELASGTLMTRLLNGDVGAGKTAVAGLLATVVVRAGYSAALLAPTEILAGQHYRSLQKLYGQEVSVRLWTGSTKHAKKDEAELVVGTHALLYDKIDIPNLALIVVDEQHRFGVRQRALLRAGRSTPPHLLSMTATPIPRTLALTLFADLQVSFLRGLPAGRKPIITEVVRSTAERYRMHQCILQELAAGHQVFVVCPAIQETNKSTPEESEGEELTLFDLEGLASQGKQAVEAEAARLAKEHPEYGEIAMLHGKMKSAEKQAVMARVEAGEVRVLVATTVVEVGVDVPNATVLIVEGAERFGLAQLHQLRGRVGRGGDQAYCFLCPSTPRAGNERLQVLVENTDGFAIAEADLALRGPGDLVGVSQSGLPDFQVATLTDLDFLREVREIVQKYTSEHPDYLQQESTKGYSALTVGLE